MVNYNIKLNIGGIILYENLTKSSYLNFDIKNTEHVLKLLYCIISYNNPDNRFLYDDFLQIISNDKIFKSISKQLESELAYHNQFINVNDKGNFDSIDNHSENIDVTKPTIKKIVSNLIINCGLDFNYIYNNITISDLFELLSTYDEKVKSELILSRLWTYINILPHIDSKKLKSPKELYPFSWEQDDNITDDKFNSAIEEYKNYINKRNG